MTTYEIPTLPDVPAVWLLDDPELGPGPYRCPRVGHNTWQLPDGRVMTSDELLALGTVSDVHPDLPADAPLPWRRSGDTVLAADARAVRFHGDVVDFIVRAVNAYGERFAGGKVPPVDALTATLQAELAEVLGEVNALLAGRGEDVRRAEAALRARLDRA